MFEFSLPFWALLALGALLAACELITGAFVVLLFGIGFIVTGLLALVIPEMNIGVQLLIGSSVGGVLVLIYTAVRGGRQKTEPVLTYTFTQGRGTLEQGQDGIWRVFCNGTYWLIRNVKEAPNSALQAGQLVTVVRFEHNHAVIDWK